MVDVPRIDGVALRRAVTMSAAVDALEQTFANLSSSSSPARVRHEIPSGELLLMPAWDHESMGVKLVTVGPRNPAAGLPLIHALYVLFDGATGRPAALFDGEALTALRTAAVSAVATRALAPADALSLVVFGAGAQARAHLESMIAVRPIRRVRIVSRTRSGAAALAREAADRYGIEVEVGEPGDEEHADVVCTCTSSPTPVVRGALLGSGTHVNAVGSYTPDRRELDDDAMRRATVVVETKETALREAGDVVLARASGALDDDRIFELSDVLAGEVAGIDRDGPTIFKSVGTAFEDLAIARLAYRLLA